MDQNLIHPITVLFGTYTHKAVQFDEFVLEYLPIQIQKVN